MDKARFSYVTYVSSTPESVWNALTSPKVTAVYWQHENLSDWKPGSRWEHRDVGEDRTLQMVGHVVESRPPRRLVLTWAEPQDEKREEKHSQVAFDIEPVRGVVRLTVTHDRLEPGSQMLEGISEGWPIVLSSLKTLLETGQPLPKLW